MNHIINQIFLGTTFTGLGFLSSRNFIKRGSYFFTPTLVLYFKSFYPFKLQGSSSLIVLKWEAAVTQKSLFCRSVLSFFMKQLELLRSAVVLSSSCKQSRLLLQPDLASKGLQLSKSTNALSNLELGCSSGLQVQPIN